MKTKDSRETVRTFSIMIKRKNRPKKFWVEEGTQFAGELMSFYFTRGTQIYPRMSEANSASSEHKIGSQKKNVFYSYMEVLGKNNFISSRFCQNVEIYMELLDWFETGIVK